MVLLRLHGCHGGLRTGRATHIHKARRGESVHVHGGRLMLKQTLLEVTLLVLISSKDGGCVRGVVWPGRDGVLPMLLQQMMLSLMLLLLGRGGRHAAAAAAAAAVIARKGQHRLRCTTSFEPCFPAFFVPQAAGPTPVPDLVSLFLWR